MILTRDQSSSHSKYHFLFHRSSNLAKKNKNKNRSYSFNSVPSESTHQWDWVEWLLGHWHQTFIGQRHAASPVPLHAFFIHLYDGDWHYMLCLHASLYSDRSLKSGCLHVSNGLLGLRQEQWSKFLWSFLQKCTAENAIFTSINIYIYIYWK